MISATLVGDDKVRTWLRTRYPLIEQGLQTAMARIVIKLARKIKEEKLSGQVLKNRTGTLRRSISPDVQQSPGVIKGTVSTNVVYAAIHEFGGTTKPHVIMPKHAKALAWLRGGGEGMDFSDRSTFKQSGGWTTKGGQRLGAEGALQFARIVHHPGSRIPARPFMRPSLEEMADEIRSEFSDAILRVVKP